MSGRARSYSDDLAELDGSPEGEDEHEPAFSELLRHSDMRIVLRHALAAGAAC